MTNFDIFYNISYESIDVFNSSYLNFQFISIKQGGHYYILQLKEYFDEKGCGKMVQKTSDDRIIVDWSSEFGINNIQINTSRTDFNLSSLNLTKVREMDKIVFSMDGSNGSTFISWKLTKSLLENSHLIEIVLLLSYFIVKCIWNISKILFKSRKKINNNLPLGEPSVSNEVKNKSFSRHVKENIPRDGKDDYSILDNIFYEI